MEIFTYDNKLDNNNSILKNLNQEETVSRLPLKENFKIEIPPKPITVNHYLCSKYSQRREILN